MTATRYQTGRVEDRPPPPSGQESGQLPHPAARLGHEHPHAAGQGHHVPLAEHGHPGRVEHLEAIWLTSNWSGEAIRA